MFTRVISAMLKFAAVLGCLMVLPASHALAVEKGVITFTTAPTQSVKETQRIYGPLVDYLAKVSGKDIKLVPARNFLEYTSKMRKGKYDIVFDGPHLVSWRMDKVNHVPLARLPGELVFVAAVKDGVGVTDIKQLIGKKVCAVNSPNLATLTVLDLFPNPARQPLIISVRSFKEAFQCMKSGRGMAAFLPVKFWNKFTKKGKTGGMSIVYSSDKAPLPTRTFSVSNRLDEETQDKLKHAFLNTNGVEGAKPLLERFRSKSFVPATEQEFEGLSRLLSSVWGFHE